MIINGNLDLRNCENLTSLGNLKEVKGYLDLEETKITFLPDGLKIGKDLYLERTLIVSLPKDLNVKEYLWLNDSKINKEYIKENHPNLLKKCRW